MSKSEMVNVIAESAEIRKTQAEKALEAFINLIGSELQKGEKIQVAGFGTFEVTCRAARTGRNPQTGEEIEISASKNVKFKAAKALKDRVK